MRLQDMLQLPSGTRLLYVMLVLACYQGSFLAQGQENVVTEIVYILRQDSAIRNCNISEYQIALGDMLSNMGSVDPEAYNDINRRLQLHARCRRPSLLGRTGLEDLSLCPWTYVENVDQNRSPRILLEAKCSCGRCRGFRGRRFLSCQPIHYSAAVIRHVCTSNGTESKWSRQKIAVACICAKLNVRRTD